MSLHSDGLCQYAYVGFSRCNKFLHASTYMLSEKAIRLWHPDYDPKIIPNRTQKLMSLSMSRRCRHATFHPNPCSCFLSNLANRQTDKRTQANAFTSSFVGGNNKRTQDKINVCPCLLMFTYFSGCRLYRCHSDVTRHCHNQSELL